mgnify:CR=1 FL=1
MLGHPSLGKLVSTCCLASMLAIGGLSVQAQETSPPLTVSEGKLVSLEYTLTLETDKTVLESNVGGKPLTYTHGSQQIIPGLEKALAGLKVGDAKEVVVPPGDGYGDVDPQAVQEVKKDLVPSDAHKVGTRLQGKLPDGRPVFPLVAAVKDDTVVLDFNHPLAGKTLHFDVKVVHIESEQAQPAPAGNKAEPK